MVYNELNTLVSNIIPGITILVLDAVFAIVVAIQRTGRMPLHWDSYNIRINLMCLKCNINKRVMKIVTFFVKKA